MDWGTWPQVNKKFLDISEHGIYIHLWWSCSYKIVNVSSTLYFILKHSNLYVSKNCQWCSTIILESCKDSSQMAKFRFMQTSIVNCHIVIVIIKSRARLAHCVWKSTNSDILLTFILATFKFICQQKKLQRCSIIILRHSNIYVSKKFQRWCSTIILEGWRLFTREKPLKGFSRIIFKGQNEFCRSHTITFSRGKVAQIQHVVPNSVIHSEIPWKTAFFVKLFASFWNPNIDTPTPF